MAIVNPNAGGGGSKKKPVDAELNLVPFIDLLVCCICFLLITAVWTKVAQLRADQGRQKGVSQRDLPPPPKAKLTVLVGEEGYTLTNQLGLRQTIPRQGAAYDVAGLDRALGELAQREGGLASVTLAVADGIAYQHLARALEVARSRPIAKVSVSDAALRL